MSFDTQVCQALCRVLRDGIDMHRAMAARALGQIADPEALDVLVSALVDEDGDVRADAAEALSHLGEASAGAPLLENLLGDPCPEVKLSAVEGLVRTRHEDAVPWLRRLVRGRDDEIVWDEDAFYESGWDNWVDLQLKAVEALAEFGAEDAVPDIVGSIEDEDGQDLTEIAFKALARLGEPGGEALACFLDDASPRRRRRAAAAVAGADGAATAAALERALADPEPETRLAAARALAKRHPADPRLGELLSDADPRVRAAGVYLCGRCHPGRLADMLDDEAAAVRRAVLEALADAPEPPRDKATIARVRRLLGDGDPDVASAAALALASLAPVAAFEDLAALLRNTSADPTLRSGAVKGLGRIGGDGAALIDVLGDDERQVRLDAMAALLALARNRKDWPNPPAGALLAALRGELVAAPDPVAEAAPDAEKTSAETDSGEAPAEDTFPTSTLAALRGDGHGPSRVAADDGEPVTLGEEDLEFLALAQRGRGKRRVSPAPKMPAHEDVPRFAARLLGDLPRPQVASALAAALGSADSELRQNAADSLARVGEGLSKLPKDAIDRLLETLDTADRDLRLSAVRALGTSSSRRVRETLIHRLGDGDSFVRVEALRGLTRLGYTGPEFAAMLDDPDPAVRESAAEAVARAGGKDAANRLVDFAFAFEGYHRRSAGRLLRTLDRQTANRRFLATLGDADQMRAWQVAIEALEELNRPDPRETRPA